MNMNSSEDNVNGKLDFKPDESNIIDIYEEIDSLRMQLMRRNKRYTNSTFSQWRLANKLRTDQEQFQLFSAQLKQEYQRIFSLTCEANIISTEMQRHVIYTVILQTPVSYLKPQQRTMNNLCTPAIQVNRAGLKPQIWNVEKFEYNLNEMRKYYQRWKISENKNEVLKRQNPFYDNESECLIGVANIYLKALFYSSKLDYIVPIINTKGEISGSLYVVLDQTGSPVMKKQSDLQINSTTRSSMSEGISIDADEQSLNNRSPSQHSFDDEGIDESYTLFDGKNDHTTIKFTIKEARDLPESDSKNVICRYFFINPKLDQTAISIKPKEDEKIDQKSPTFSFDHKMEYKFHLNENFRTTCLENSVPVEVWYQQNSKTSVDEASDTDDNNGEYIKVQDISKCWKDVKRHIQFIVEIHELDETGEWKPVPVEDDERILSGGIYRLKQGKSKRVFIKLRILPRSDALPFNIDTIRSVEIGSINSRKLEAPLQLDSYQEEDLQTLKQQWLNLIEKRKNQIESQLHTLHQQTNKSTEDIQKENSLLEDLRQLALEQDIAVLPPAASGIPGAPAAWDPPAAIEAHRPLLFLDIDPFKSKPTISRAGAQSTLIEEDPMKMIPLPLIRNISNENSTIVLWNPSRHDSTLLDQVTPNGTLIYLIVKVIIIINEPVHMEIVLRKRIAVTMNKADGWLPKKLIKSFLGFETYERTSVVYEIVSNIPKSLYAIEDQTQIDVESISEKNIQKHIHYASAIDSLLLLDKLRQEVLLAEKYIKEQTIAKSTSAPNITSYKEDSDKFTPPTNPDEENKPSGSIPDNISHSSNTQLNQLQSPILQLENIRMNDDDLEPKTVNINLNETRSVSSSLSAESFSASYTDDTPGSFSTGDQVIVNTGHSIVSKTGTILFIGEIKGKVGNWYGIELREPVGKHNGTVKNHVYFVCAPNHGVFVRKDKIQLVPS